MWLIANLTEAALLASLVMRGLVPRWPWFALWLTVSLARFGLLQFGTSGPASHAYDRIYTSTEPLLVLALAAAVLECYRRRCADYRALGRVGTWLLTAGMMLAGGMAVGVTLAAPIQGWQAALAIALSLRRGAFVVLSLFALLTLVFLHHYRVPAASNPSHHHLILTVYLNAHLVSSFASGALGQKAGAVIGQIMLVAATGSFVAWAVALRRGGELAPALPPMEEALRAERAAEAWLSKLGG